MNNFCIFILILIRSLYSLIIDDIKIFDYEINPHPFKYLINPGLNICGENRGQNLTLLIVINTDPKRFENRDQIRETWAKRTLFPFVRVLFLMGLDRNKTINKRIKLESHIYQDILQENFIDSYHNLTHKGVMSLKWTLEYCSKVKYYMKTDDDIVLNLFSLLINLNKIRKKSIKNRIICYVNPEGSIKPIRNTKNKWYLSKKEYSLKYFKTYCAGLAYLITSDLIPKMFKISKYVRFVWIDDFFMTGILATATKAKFYEILDYYSIFEHPMKIIKGLSISSKKNTKIVFHQLNNDSRNLIWFYVKEKMLNEYLFQMRFNFKNNNLNEHCGFLDDFYWTYHDFWNRVLNRDDFMIYAKNESYAWRSKFLQFIPKKWVKYKKNC